VERTRVRGFNDQRKCGGIFLAKKKAKLFSLEMPCIFDVMENPSRIFHINPALHNKFANFNWC